MKITKVELKNFRNYSSFKIDDLKEVNIILGNNGIGKTSILESIYVCSLARSFKSNNENVLIKNGENSFRIKIDCEENNKKKSLIYLLTGEGKKTKINNSLKKKVSDFILQYKTIIFSPDELKILKESPNIRRNYINISISQINKNYIKVLNKYNTLIKQKNDYLKKINNSISKDFTYLDILDEKISELGFEINKERKEYIEKVNKYISKIYKKFNDKDLLKINYISDFNNKNIEDIKKILLKTRKREIELGLTSTGIHRDDIEFLINDLNAKDFVSQGNQKIIMLVFKLAELEILIKEYYEEPILLLDDLFSELDIENQEKTLKNISKEIQVFITTTDLNNINKKIYKKAKIIEL